MRVSARTDVVRATHGTLAKYNPDKGLKTIAVAEAAEKHYARAKDATQLQQAIRAKLTAQAEFVAWWDTQATKRQGSRGVGKKVASQTSDATIAGRNGIPDRYVIDRWRQKLSDDERFEATYQTALARYIKILELEAGAHVAQNSGENEWYTPAGFIEAARVVLGAIDLDPASTAAANEVVQAATFYSSKDNGLERPWSGRVWLNPPYAQPLISQFADKLADSVRVGAVSAAIVLVNNATETVWFQTMARIAAAICLPLGRVHFWSLTKDTAAPLQGQCFLYYGDDRVAFDHYFDKFGAVWFAAHGNDHPVRG